MHLPWCVRKCPYCDFNSHTAGEHPPYDDYLATLIGDIRAEATRADGRPIISIYLGGGTPSLFSAAHIRRILDTARQALDVAADCEITMEVNPGTVERGDLRGYRDAGVNRLSLGAQSFDAGMLEVLGRIHGPDDTVAAYRDAREAGFDSINIDLMFALPGQSLAAAIDDIEQLCRLSPPHVSYYQLTLEPNTEFHSRPPAQLPDDALAWDIQEHCGQLLAEAGYRQYEVSAFAQAGHRCRHNLNYWAFGDYLAVGAGAHGKHTAADGVIRRYCKPAHPRSYIGALPQAVAGQPVAADDAAFEYLLNALRLLQGFSERDFTARTGLAFDAIQAPLAAAEADGLMRRLPQGRWRPTSRGFRFLNDLQARFLP